MLSRDTTEALVGTFVFYFSEISGCPSPDSDGLLYVSVSVCGPSAVVATSVVLGSPFPGMLRRGGSH